MPPSRRRSRDAAPAARVGVWGWATAIGSAAVSRRRRAERTRFTSLSDLFRAMSDAEMDARRRWCGCRRASENVQAAVTAAAHR
jgi:hypothetical protein